MNVTLVQNLLGPPTYTWTGNSWIAPSNKRLFTPDELHDLFKDDCIGFFGDSTQRRAADTLHKMTQYRGNTSKEHRYLYAWTQRNDTHHRPKSRVIDEELKWYNNETFNEHWWRQPGWYDTTQDLEPTCRPGMIDNRFYPFYESLQNVTYDKQYSIVIFGIGAWDVDKKKQSPQKVKRVIESGIQKIHETIPSKVLIVWKLTGWCRNCIFEPLKNDETARQNVYLLHYGNQVAKETIERINATNLVYLDYAREVLLHSIGKTRMRPENNDANSWHIGANARILFLQMLAWEVHKRKQESSLAGARVSPAEEPSNAIRESSSTSSSSSSSSSNYTSSRVAVEDVAPGCCDLPNTTTQPFGNLIHSIGIGAVLVILFMRRLAKR